MLHVFLWIFGILFCTISCGDNPSQMHIIGTQSYTTKPFASTLFLANKENVVCGGVYLGDGKILSAHHCLANHSDMHVVLSRGNFSHKGSVWIKIESFRQIRKTDLALARLDKHSFFYDTRNIPTSLMPQPAKLYPLPPTKAVDVVIEGMGGTQILYAQKASRRTWATLFPITHLKDFVNSEAGRATHRMSWWHQQLQEMTNYTPMLLYILLRQILRYHQKRTSYIHHDFLKSFALVTFLPTYRQADSSASKIVSQNIRSMICYGDSGSPLYTFVGGELYLVGMLVGMYVNKESIYWELNDSDKAISPKLLKKSRDGSYKFPSSFAMGCSIVGLAYMLHNYLEDIQNG